MNAQTTKTMYRISHKDAETPHHMHFTNWGNDGITYELTLDPKRLYPTKEMAQSKLSALKEYVNHGYKRDRKYVIYDWDEVERHAKAGRELLNNLLILPTEVPVNTKPKHKGTQEQLTLGNKLKYVANNTLNKEPLFNKSEFTRAGINVRKLEEEILTNLLIEHL